MSDVDLKFKMNKMRIDYVRGVKLRERGLMDGFRHPSVL
jgi:hypothetical protein